MLLFMPIWKSDSELQEEEEFRKRYQPPLPWPPWFIALCVIVEAGLVLTALILSF